jgi:pimeloyl-ACP methyl ester carboxylesterase
VTTTDRARTGPIRGIIAGSLATGAAGAAVLTLVVFGGASEPVITGSALLGFALGWAVLAVLSARLTDQPQSWAWVPAAGLGATGLGLLALTPDDRAITLSGWGWPPLILSLAIWMAVRIRRSLAPGGRWLLYPVAAIVAAAGIGGMVETVGLALDQRDHAMPGQSYDVGGYRLHLTCTGSGGPTVVLQSGLGEMSANWARIVPLVGGTTRVCAYDRAGQGWSEDAPHLQDGVQAAADLHTLLRRAGENGPFVLVGHSIGGDHAMTYAARYPEQVAGVVLLDATDPHRSAGTGSASTGPPGEIALLPSLARLGIGRLLPTSFWSALPEPAAGQVQAFVASPRGWRNTRDEATTMPALLDQARALTSLGSTPLVVLTAAGHDRDPSWLAAQDRMAALSTDTSHRMADATHAGLLDEEQGAEQSARAIGDVVDAVRTGSPLAGA